MLFPCAHASVNNGAGILQAWVRSGHSAPYKRGCLKSPDKPIARQPSPNPQGSVNPCKGGGKYANSYKNLAQSEAWPKGEGAGTANNRDGTENRGLWCPGAPSGRHKARCGHPRQAILALLEYMVFYQIPVTRTTSRRLYLAAGCILKFLDRLGSVQAQNLL